ncbi:hypothetical protein BJ138DRAFT_977888, partial [Hygrophoropsis aurantiaca]
MAPKEPTRHQLSSRLQYNQKTPAFLQKFQNRMQGVADDEDDEDPAYYDDGSGRPPIPQRPAIPQRPESDPGSADEDDADEKPQVVVLREGKHLTEREVENERRREKGLPPLPDLDKQVDREGDSSSKHAPEKSSKVKEKTANLSFSSSGLKSKPTNKLKRKVIGDVDDCDSDAGEK